MGNGNGQGVELIGQMRQQAQAQAMLNQMLLATETQLLAPLLAIEYQQAKINAEEYRLQKGLGPEDRVPFAINSQCINTAHDAALRVLANNGFIELKEKVTE